MKKFGALVKNNRVVYAESSDDFLNNLGVYLYFSQNARFLGINSFEAESLPNDLYNFEIINNNLKLIDVPIIEEHVQPILKLNKDLTFIKEALKKPTRLLLESYGHDNVGSYINLRLKEISEKLLKGLSLSNSEWAIFNYEKSKYDNVTDETMAKMLLTQINIWNTRLDNIMLETIKSIDNNISGGF
jgi:hypothetical protein